MKTITIKVPDFLNELLDAEAVSKRVSKSSVIREALLRSLPSLNSRQAPSKRKPSIHDRLQKYQGAGGTGVKDLASNPKHLADYGRK